MLSVSFLLLLLGPIGTALAAIGPVTDLHIVNAFIQPDGFNRSGVLAEGVFPGPLITGNKGDNFQINVIDELTNGTMLLSTSILINECKWRGLDLRSLTNAPSLLETRFSTILMSPIKQARFFFSETLVPHESLTCFINRNVLVRLRHLVNNDTLSDEHIDPHADLYDVDDALSSRSRTGIVRIEEFHVLLIYKQSILDVPAPQAGAVPRADATLINGLGRSVNGPAGASLAVINVVQGARYRFRLVSISCDPNFVFSIDGHTFTIIEVDGVNHESVVADSIQIFAAQRYSFILTANQSVSNYWVRANPNVGNTGFTGGINSAILRYNGAPVTDPTTTSTSSNALKETSLVPLENPGAPGTATASGVDVDLNLALTNGGGKFFINGVSFVPPTVPVLLQILSGATTAAQLLPAGSVYSLPLNSVIQLSFKVGAAGAPHTFDVVRSAGSTTYNYANPPRRDVVSTGAATDNVTIRFTTDNAGPWFLHCHIDWHLEAGFAIVFAEDAPDVASADPVPDAWSQLCPIYNNLTTAQLGGQ
ncbi:hypothetical protein D9757_012523 [Collybiopsis confluens]|uniref:laccase n=1 Tax=Collybiopsis confluens TaxID=2823264 RepID=A0A8H5LGB2_9AGAR|nr:hypothetical protein D9757_012523 [Collybiopsis confluens]